MKGSHGIPKIKKDCPSLLHNLPYAREDDNFWMGTRDNIGNSKFIVAFRGSKLVTQNIEIRLPYMDFFDILAPYK